MRKTDRRSSCRLCLRCSLRPSIPLLPLRFSVAGSGNPTLQLVIYRPSCPFYVIRPPGGSRSVCMESEDVPVGDRKESVRVKKKTLQAVLEQCQRALERLSDDKELDDCGDDDCASDGANLCRESSLALRDETEADELCDLLKSRVKCPDFLEKIENAHVATPPSSTEEGSSWDLVSDSDIWDNEKLDVDKDDYVMVREEDIVDAIACFMAAYLASLKETKVLSPDQLQEALTKTFSLKKKKGKFRKAWDGSKVIYNVASWGATAIGIYQNPVILSAASQAFWTSCQVISKLL